MELQTKEFRWAGQKKYKILQELGKGFFSTVFECVDLSDSKQYALKLQFKSTKGHDLKKEIQIINDLKKRLQKIQYEMAHIIKIPEIFAYHIKQQNTQTQNQAGNFCVMSLCQKSLQAKMIENKQLFSLQMILLIGYLLICIIEGIHKTGYLHRDIKPQNILIQKKQNQSKKNQENKNEVALVLVDFGLSMRYLNQKDENKHFQFLSNKKLTGSLEFSSLNSHKGYRFSRRDEIQNILYTLIFLKNGTLPWSQENIKCQIQQKRDAKVQKIVQNMKDSISIQQLCKQFQQQFIKIFHYIRKLKFQQEPDYTYIKQNIKKVLNKINSQQKQYKKTNFQTYLKQKLKLLAV